MAATRIRCTSLRRQSWQRITAAPSLDLRFAETKSDVDVISGQNLITFTRASSGTYVDSDGLIKTATTNLLLRSEEFDNASWTKNDNPTVTANQIAAPNGTLTADQLVGSGSATGYLEQTVSIVNGLSYTFSVFLKKRNTSTVNTLLYGSQFNSGGSNAVATWNLDTGSASFTNGATGSMVAVGDGWYRCIMIDTATTTNASSLNQWIRLVGNSGDCYLWGAQLEQSSTVGEYIPTTSTINSAPRFDHNPTTGESLGLLVEEARTNSIRNNTMVGAVAGTPGTLPTNWVVGNLGTLSQQIVGTGTINGVQYIDWRVSGTSSTTSVTLGFEPTTQVVAASGESWSISAYAARVGGSVANIAYVGIGIYERTSAGVFVVANNSPADLSNVTTFARVTYSATLAGGATVARVQPLLVMSITSGAAIDITLRIGLPQLEQGAFATSVIPTTGAAATRSADVASITGSNFSAWYRQDEGTFVCGFTRNVLIESSNFANLFAVSDNTANERILSYNTGSTQTIDVAVTDAGVAQALLLSPEVVTANSLQRLAISYRVNDFAAVRNAGTATVDNSGSLPTVDRLYIGSNHNGLRQFNGYIRRLTYYPARLSDANLRALTQ